MRNLDERIAEINRRSEKILKERKKRKKCLLLGCVPLVLCLSIIAGLFFQWTVPAREGTMFPTDGDVLTYFAQMDEQSGRTGNGAVAVFGPGMIRIHLDRDTVSTASNLLFYHHSTNADFIVDGGCDSSVTYRIILNLYGVKTKYRLSGNTLEIMPNGKSYTLTDDEVSLLKDVLCIPEISVTIRRCIIILTVILLLAVLVICIWKNTGYAKCPLRKQTRIIILISVLLPAVLFVPIPNPKCSPLREHMEYTALTYKVVYWGSSGRTGYQDTAWYGFPDNFKSLDTLWSEYLEPRVRTVTATVLQISDDTVVVQPIKAEGELPNAECLCFSKKYLAKIDPAVGGDVDIDYIGDIMETDQIQVIRWRMTTDLRHREYSGQWLNPETAKRHFEHQGPAFTELNITEIYADCFIAHPTVGGFEVKLNGRLSDEWSVGDYVICTYEKLYFDEENRRMEADMLTIKACDEPQTYTYPVRAFLEVHPSNSRKSHEAAASWLLM